MQKKSVKKNRRRANQTRRMRGGDHHTNLVALFIIISAWLLVSMIKSPNANNFVTPSNTDYTLLSVPPSNPVAQSNPVPPLNTVPPSNTVRPLNHDYIGELRRQAESRQRKELDESGSNPVPPLNSDPINELMRQAESRRLKELDESRSNKYVIDIETIMKNEGLSNIIKKQAIKTFLNNIKTKGLPSSYARISSVMAFCSKNHKLCKQITINHPFFKEFMKNYDDEPEFERRWDGGNPTNPTILIGKDGTIETTSSDVDTNVLKKLSETINSSNSSNYIKSMNNAEIEAKIKELAKQNNITIIQHKDGRTTVQQM